MNRLTVSFLLATAVHGIFFIGWSKVLDQTPKMNVQSGQTSVRMAFQATRAAAAESQPQETEQNESSGPKNEKPESKQSRENDDPSESQSSDGVSPSEPKPSSDPSESAQVNNDTDTTSSTSSNPTESFQKSKTDESTKNDSSKENERNNEETQEVPDSVRSKGARWVEDVEYRKNPSPRYPTKARVMGVEGTVRLLVRIDASGRPESITVHESSGSFRLDEAALETVRSWQFEPAREDGEPVESATIVPVRFTLDG